MAEDEFTALLWGAAHAARVGILCNGFLSRLVGGHGASADSIVVQCKCKGCGSRSPSRAPEGNLFTLDDWAAHCGAITEPLRLSVFSVVQPGAPKERVPLLDWLNMANEAMGGESLHRRQLCVLFPGPDEEEGTPYHWRAGTIRHIDPVSGAAEVKYHDDRRKRSKAHLYLPLAVMHWARCPPPPETPPRTVAEGCQPLPPLLLPGMPLPPRPPPQPASEEALAALLPSSQQLQSAKAVAAAVMAPSLAATAAHTVKMEAAAQQSAPPAAKERAPHSAAQQPAAAAAAARPKPKPEPDTSRRPTPAACAAAAKPLSQSLSLSLLAAAAAADAAAAAAAAAPPAKPGPMRRYTKRPHGADDPQQLPSWPSPPQEQHKEQKRRDGAAPGEGRPWAAADASCPHTAAAASTAATAVTAVPMPALAAVGSSAASACEGGASSNHNAANDASGAYCGRGRGLLLPPSWSSAELNNTAHVALKPQYHYALSAPAPVTASQPPASCVPPAPLQPQSQQPAKQQMYAADQDQLFLGSGAAVPSLSTFSSSSTDLESLLNGDDNAFDSTADGSPASAVDEFAALTAAAAAGAVGGANGYYACHNYSSSGAESDGGRHGAGLAYGGGGSGVFSVQAQQQQLSHRGNSRSPSLVPSMGAAAPEPQQLQTAAPAPMEPAFVTTAQPIAAFASGGAGCSLAAMEWQPARTSYSSSGGSGGIVVPGYDSATVSASAAASAAAAAAAAAAAESLAAAAGTYTMRVYWQHYNALMKSPQQQQVAAPPHAAAPMQQQQQLSPRTVDGSSSGCAFWQQQSPVPAPSAPHHHALLTSSGSGIFCCAPAAAGCGGAAPAAAPRLPLPPAAADENVADANLKILLSEIEELQWPLPQPIAV